MWAGLCLESETWPCDRPAHQLRTGFQHEAEPPQFETRVPPPQQQAQGGPQPRPSWHIELHAIFQEHATVQHRETGPEMSVEVWYVHHTSMPICNAPRLIRLDDVQELWYADLCNAWFDQIQRLQPIRIHVVKPTPAYQLRPQAIVHLILEHSLLHDANMESPFGILLWTAKTLRVVLHLLYLHEKLPSSLLHPEASRAWDFEWRTATVSWLISSIDGNGSSRFETCCLCILTHVFAPRHGRQYGQAPCCMACMHVPFHVVHDPPEALEGYFGPEETTQTTICNVGADQWERWLHPTMQLVILTQSMWHWPLWLPTTWAMIPKGQNQETWAK